MEVVFSTYSFLFEAKQVTYCLEKEGVALFYENLSRFNPKNLGWFLGFIFTLKNLCIEKIKLRIAK